MSIVSKYPVYYQVMYRVKVFPNSGCYLSHCMGCFEDIRDAMTKIIRLHGEKPNYKGEIGIVRTSIKDNGKFVASTYRD